MSIQVSLVWRQFKRNWNPDFCINPFISSRPKQSRVTTTYTFNELSIIPFELLQLFSVLSQNFKKFQKSDLTELSMKLIPKFSICCIFLSWQQEEVTVEERTIVWQGFRHTRKHKIHFWHSVRKTSLLNDLIVAEDKVFPTSVEECVYSLVHQQFLRNFFSPPS